MKITLVIASVTMLIASQVCGQAVQVQPQDPAAVSRAISDAADAKAKAATAVQPSDLSAAIVAATPPDCTAPLSDALIATPGVQPRCMPRPDAQRAAIVQAAMVVTTADGSFSGNWPAPFPAEPTARFADIDVLNGSSAPYKCSFTTNQVTATSFAGHCWQIVATTLPTTATALLGLVVSPLNNAAAGLTVRVTGRR